MIFFSLINWNWYCTEILDQKHREHREDTNLLDKSFHNIFIVITKNDHPLAADLNSFK